MYSKSLFIFRRDLRLSDNTGLIEALQKSQTVYPIFIFDTKQVTDNEFKSSNAIQFMLESLEDLHEQLKKKDATLECFYGETLSILKNIIETEDIDAVFVNEDYTPFAQKRDANIKKLCEEHHCAFESFSDYTLSPLKTLEKQSGGWYTVFTPFYNTAKTIPVSKPQECNTHNFAKTQRSNTISLTDVRMKILPQENKSIIVRGGRSNALTILKQLQTHISNYAIQRDYPHLQKTSLLSAHHKFGTISVRESFHQTKNIPGLQTHFTRELYWRDFYLYIAYHFPKVFGEEFQEKYADIQWSYDEKLFKAWCEGKTGFPIVDAGMRQLNTTGYMHNRVRMIVASFLIKDLLIDWRLGEKYFAQKLVDYDPSVNNGSWQWAASTGCDAQPYFRIFNPWLQQKRFDVDCTYIKKWVPELRDCTAQEIHNIQNQRPITPIAYPTPIVDHAQQKEKALAMFKSV